MEDTPNVTPWEPLDRYPVAVASNLVRHSRPRTALCRHTAATRCSTVSCLRTFCIQPHTHRVLKVGEAKMGKI